MNYFDIEKKDLEYILESLKKEFNRIAGKNLLITGGGGFLGYYLVKSVLYWNDTNINKIHLYVLDNFIRGTPKWITELQSNLRSDFTLINQSIIEPFSLENVNFSYIIHAASIASPHYYRLYPIETMDANVIGLRNLLNYAVSQKEIFPVEGFLFFSSSEIYGNPPNDCIPTPETYRGYVSCTGPRACYDESKRFGETLCVNFYKVYNIPIVIARPFNNYGPGLKISDRRVIADFARNILFNEDIVLYSNGFAKRTFCYISDAIIGYYKLLLNGYPGESYNIGVSEPEISIFDLAKKVQIIGENFFGYTGNIIFQSNSDMEYLTDNPERRCPNIFKSMNEIDYYPKISLDEGLKRTMHWYYNVCKDDEVV